MTDLTDRMRTCAAHIDHLMSHNTTRDLITVNPLLVIDAAELLREAADALEKFVVEPAQKAVEAQLEQLGEPMKIIEPLPPTSPPSTFTDPGPPAAMPTRSSRSCPVCGSRANKTVHVAEKKLECPVCQFTWPYVLEGKWV